MAVILRLKPSARPRPRRATLTAYAFLAPSAVGVLCFAIVPIGVIVWLTFQRWNLLGQPQFVGVANYISVLTDPVFVSSLLVSLALVAFVVPLQTALGLTTAMLLARGLPGTSIFRLIYAIPWICAPLALGIVWKWIFAPSDGLLTSLSGARVEWLSDPLLALPATAVVVIWTNVGYVTLFLLAGLLNIPAQVTDAARVDGAGAASIFWHITLPLLRPTMFFVVVTSAISVFQIFDQVFGLTGGGPDHSTDVVANRIYLEAFRSFDFGRAAVMAVVVLVILAAISLGCQRYFRRRMTYETR